MTDNITVIGAVGSDPRVHTTAQGLTITSFRLASTRRIFDRLKGTWEDGDTNWYTVSTFRQLAKNASSSIRRGDRVVVHGRLRLRAWESGEKSGTAIEIDAEAVGHDLTWGTTTLSKTRASGASGGADAAAAASSTGIAEGWPTDPADVAGDADERAAAAFASDREAEHDDADGDRDLEAPVDERAVALPF
ncbi:single-stranded DNA-binding protein [Agromyces allii]|uniref:Single-stranded DNA-binding protein n=1 Tax=Agromyces allii TaxID=393607 RepID=A0ABN2QEX4_9MICO|nr:single-stranded DNA-binding protein [Agromyces allii]